jgi:hypothetical protein
MIELLLPFLSIHSNLMTEPSGWRRISNILTYGRPESSSYKTPEETRPYD